MAGKSKLQTVYKKYSNPERGAAYIEPNWLKKEKEKKVDPSEEEKKA